jgi:phage terminase large subunit
MKYKETKALHKILSLKKRLRIIQGGSSAGKTIAILMILTDIAQSHKNTTISVVSETFPHLRKGAIKDFLEIMKDRNYYKDDLWNKTDSTYTFETGSIIEFFSADQPSKVHGPRRHILFLNEANNISYDTYKQLALRTSDVIFVDYNPVQEFWVHSDIVPNVDHDFIILTYKDNDGLPENIIKEIESHKKDKNFWLVYGLGQLGEAEGRIYKDWQIIDTIPHEARLDRYGLDFGYTNDPSVILAIYYYNGGYILDEVVYQKGLSNKQLADIFINEPRALVYADSAEPKSIDEIKLYGVSILPCTKGQDSINQGIQFVQQQRISVTKRSVNTIKEYRNYLWQTDKDGKIINKPTDVWNHSMDSIRYGFNGLIQKENEYTPINNFSNYAMD